MASATIPEKLSSLASLTVNNIPGSIPRKVTAEQVFATMTGEVNPFNKTSFSATYKNLLDGRKKLPMFAEMHNFYEMYSNNQVLIISGETGSGKTTQIPQFVVYSDLPHTKDMTVVCTQPRRVAAMSVAKRVAEEMDVSLGKEVGYTIRFEDMTDPETTLLKYTTDETLLQEAVNDPLLQSYSTIILDEAHERALATDILMTLLKSVIKIRSDLKLIVMSATLDALKFQTYFRSAFETPVPLFKVPGRTYPVEIFYTHKPEPDYLEAAIRTVVFIHRTEEPGDILLFLSDEEEIEETCRKISLEAACLMKSAPDLVGPLVCYPLYSSLPPLLQQKIFDKAPPPLTPNGPPGRKVIVSTNIAETSLTIDGIVYVVDPGFSKSKLYNPRVDIDILLVHPISKASAQQRAGRVGRTRPGKCFRLYTEDGFTKELEDQSHPEISRCNLANVVLRLLQLGIKDLVSYDYIDAPAPESLMRALEVLNYLSAIDNEGQITSQGLLLASFPINPQLAKMLVVSPEFGCSSEALSIAAMLSVPDIWVRPQNRRKEADAAKALLSVSDGDHFTLLNVYRLYKQNAHNKSWALDNYLSKWALSQADKARAQLQRIMEQNNLVITSTNDKRRLYDGIKKALICGFFMQVAHRQGRGNQGSYFMPRDHQPVALHQSCGLNPQPEWVLFNERAITTPGNGPASYIRTVTTINPQWLLEHAPGYYDLSCFPDGATKRALRNLRRY